MKKISFKRIVRWEKDFSHLFLHIAVPIAIQNMVAASAHIVDGQWGVYIRYGDLVRFKNIAPIYENDEYMLLPVQSTASDSINQVVLYDEVIVSGRDLYDGKLL